MSAMDTAVYWVEYVIRNGLDNKTPKSHFLNWYQYLLFDVTFFAVTVFVLVALFLHKFIKHVDRIFNSLKDKKSD